MWLWFREVAVVFNQKYLSMFSAYLETVGRDKLNEEDIHDITLQLLRPASKITLNTPSINHSKGVALGKVQTLLCEASSPTQEGLYEEVWETLNNIPSSFTPISKTSHMDKGQMTEFLEEVLAWYTTKGINLPVPENSEFATLRRGV